jgi:hypothetical protein
MNYPENGAGSLEGGYDEFTAAKSQYKDSESQ